MRYYNIVITDPATSSVIKRWTSLSATGAVIPGALNIEMDFPVYNFDASNGAAYLKVWGISIQDISQSFDFRGKTISVYAGMSKGLPLANKSQSGLILSGTINQSFGNWQGTNQSLDFYITQEFGSPDSPKNIVLTWKKGVPLDEVIKIALNIGFPDYLPKINISPNLVLGQDEVGYFQSIGQFSQYIKNISTNIINLPDYAGVNISVKDKIFIVEDGTTQTTPKEIVFTDLIGQPTWINFGAIQFKAVMRADLHVNDYIKMPNGMVTTTQQSYSNLRNKSAFSGVFKISELRHVGNFRQQDANSWVTVVNAYLVNSNV